MLVISRKEGESFTIDGTTKVTIQKVKGSCISISIDAPPDVRIVRDDAKKPNRKNFDLPTHVEGVVFDLQERKYYYKSSDIFFTSNEEVVPLGLKPYSDIDLLDRNLIDDPVTYLRARTSNDN